MNLVKASMPILAALLFIRPGLSKDDVPAEVAADLKARFLARYKPAAEKLESFYGASIIRFKRIVNGSETTEWTFKGAKPSFRLDNSDSTGVKVVSPVRSFRLVRESPSDPFIVDSVGADYEDSLEELRRTVKIPWVPFSSGGYILVKGIQLPVCQIQRMEEIEVDNRKLVKVSYRSRGSPRVGWFLFDPENCWALMGFESWPEDHPEYFFRERFEYGEKIGDVPLLKKAEYSRYVDKEPYLAFEVMEIQPASVPPEEFDLEKLMHGRFGEDQEPSSKFWFYGITLGLFLLMMILIVRRHYQDKAASRRQRTP